MTSVQTLARAVLAIAVTAAGLPSPIVHAVPAFVTQQPFGTPQPFGPGRCGPVDPAFAELSAATGGQMFLLSPSEMETAGPAIAAATATSANRDSALLVSAFGTASDAVEPLSFAVDGSIRRVVITAMFDSTGGTLAVAAADGAPIEANDHIQDARLNCGRILVVDRPAAGAWQANASPTGRFWLRVQAVTGFDLAAAEFVASGDPQPRSEMVKLAGQPVAGGSAVLSVDVRGPAMKSYDFALVSEGGRVIKQVALAQVGEQRWQGSIDVPAEPFRVAVSGVDESGARYQRLSKSPFHPGTAGAR